MTDLRLTIAPDRVTLQGANLSVEQTPQGLQPGMADYLRLLDRVRVSRDDRRFAPGRGGVDPQRAVGVLLHSAYLAGPVADHLDVLIEGGAVRIGLALDDRLAALPWETVGPVRGDPLVLRHGVTLHRVHPGELPWHDPAPVFSVVAAVAQPDDVRLPLIDHDRELRNLLDVLSAARRRQEVALYEVRFATAALLRDTVQQRPSHVLHLACHARAGQVLLETADGGSDPVDAHRLVAEVLSGPDGTLRTPFVALLGCSTDVAGSGAGSEVGSLARSLMAAGAHGVLAMAADVGDRYAARFAEEWYTALLGSGPADPATAAATARRAVERERRGLPDDDPDVQRLRDWSAAVVYLREGFTVVPGWNPPHETGTAAAPTRARSTGPVSVGRRAEERRLRARAAEPATITVVLGHTGFGVSEMLTRLQLAVDRGPLAPAATQRGQLDIAALHDRLAPVRSDRPTDLRGVLALIGSSPRLPPLIWDDFTENTVAEDDDSGFVVLEPDVVAVLDAWTSGPTPSSVLLGARLRFRLPAPLDERIAWCPLEDLPASATRLLVDRLGITDRTDVASLGGHPGALTRLAARPASSAGVVGAAVADRALAGAPRRVLADDLTARMARGLAAFRTPFWKAAAAWQVLPVDDAALRSDRLEIVADPQRPTVRPPLRVDDPRLVEDATRALAALVRTGVVIRRRHPRDVDHLFAISAPLRAALGPTPADHSRAADHWLWIIRGGLGPLERDDSLAEALHHLRCAGRTAEADGIARELARARHRAGAWDDEAAIAEQALADAPTPADVAYWSARLGALRRLRGDHGAAARLLSRSAAIARRLGDHDGVLVAHGELAALATDTHHLRSARRHATALVQLAAERGDLSRRAAGLCQLGALDVLENRYADARDHHMQAMSLYRDLEDPEGEQVAQVNLAILDVAVGRLDDALARYGHALRIPAADGVQLARLQHLTAIALARRGSVTRALDLLRTAIAVAIVAGAPELVAAGYHQIATVLQRHRADPTVVIEYLRRSELIETELGSPRRLATTCLNLGVVHQDLGDLDEAQRQYRRVLALEGSDRSTIAHATHQLGVVAELVGDRELAVSRCREALARYRAIGLTREAAVVQCQLGVLLLRSGERGGGADLLMDGYAGLRAAAADEHLDQAVADLRELRRVLGRRRFDRLARRHLDDDGRTRLIAVLAGGP